MGACIVWRFPALIVLGTTRMKWFEHLPVARDVDICCATTSPTEHKKSEPDVVVGKVTHSASRS